MKKLKRLFIRYFVPHKRNKYQPHFLRLEVAGSVALLIVVIFLGSIAQEKIVTAPQSAAVVAATLVNLANTDRSQNGIGGLAESPVLDKVAQLKADDMAAKGYFAHDSPDGHDPWYFFAQEGYNFTYAGENLAVYFSDSGDVNTAWMNSPEHRANLLDPHFTQVGIATAEGMYQGVETTFVAEEFGAPAAAPVATAPVPVQPQPSPVAAASGTPAPEVAGVSTGPTTPKAQAPAQKENFIEVSHPDATPAAAAQPTAAPKGFGTPLLSALTSPRGNLMLAYEIIGAIVALALILEVGVEVRRQHPHRIAVGLSLIALMVILVFADRALLTGAVLIA